MDSNPIQNLASTPMVAKVHKEDQQATGDLNSLGVTSEEGAHPQLSSGMSAFTNIKPVFSASYIFHSESASGNYVLADFTVEADPEISAPNDSIKPNLQEMGHKLPTMHQVQKWTQDQLSWMMKTKKIKESSEEYAERNKDTHAEPKSTSVPPCRIQESLSLHHVCACACGNESDFAGMRYLHLHIYINPEIKQSAIKLVDEYGFVIRPDFGWINLEFCEDRPVTR
ncbi:hypothetical protein Tco_0304769 [Tanacetum coccineum]